MIVFSPAPFIQIQEVQARNSQMKEECTEMAARLQRKRAGAVEGEVEFNQVSKHIQQGKERETSLLEDRATLEIRHRHRTVEARSLYEAQIAKAKEKDREIRLGESSSQRARNFMCVCVCVCMYRALKKVDMQLSFIKQSQEQVYYFTQC